MAMNLHNSQSNNIRIEGDLGDLQVTEESSDSEEEKYDKQSAVTGSRTLSTVSSIPQSLLHSSATPDFGNVSVCDSENVQFGNNTYFNGPVTIKQIVNHKTGVENESYNKTEEETNCDTFPKKPRLDETYIKKHEILMWHKLTFSVVCLTVIAGIVAVVLILQSKGDHQNTIPLADFNDENGSAACVVVGYYDNLQIFISIVILPLIFLWIFYSLLTRHVMTHGFIRTKSHGNSAPTVKFSTQYRKADQLIFSPDYLRIVSRSDWLAQPVVAALDKIRQPVPWVIITHTATESCTTQSQCVLRVRLIQNFHVESRGWYDIGYNFLIGGDGSAYYGRGWDYIGAHTQGYNKYSIGIAFIGTFNGEPPPKHQIEACQKIIQQGVQLGKLAKDYKLLVHRQLMSTLSPGDKLFDIIKTWPHFVSNFTDVKELIPNY